MTPRSKGNLKSPLTPSSTRLASMLCARRYHLNQLLAGQLRNRERCPCVKAPSSCRLPATASIMSCTRRPNRTTRRPWKFAPSNQFTSRLKSRCSRLIRQLMSIRMATRAPSGQCRLDSRLLCRRCSKFSPTESQASHRFT